MPTYVYTHIYKECIFAKNTYTCIYYVCTYIYIKKNALNDSGDGA